MSKQLILAAILVLSSASWSIINAQLIRSASPKDKAVEDKYRSDEIERVRREAATPRYRPTARFPQIKEDFERIQVINSKVLQVTASETSIDYERISDAAAEIRKRATRLKSNLFPSVSKEGRKQIGRPTEAREDLKFLLTELDKAIITFVHNPIFENTRLVDPQDSERAERELEKIIYLSARTRKKAERRNS